MLPLHSGWAGWALAHPDFGSSVNPITTRGADYAHHIIASPPGFENSAAALVGTLLIQTKVLTNPINYSEYKKIRIKMVLKK